LDSISPYDLRTLVKDAIERQSPKWKLDALKEVEENECSATIWMGMRIASGRNVPERLFVASS
jgi:hypothetical protein